MSGSDVASALRCCATCGASYRAAFARCPNDGGVVATVARDPLIGATLEPYAIDGVLGEGAMGRVYRARHARLAARQYAIKVLWGDLAIAPEARIRFAREAQSASLLDHPNVVGVVDFGRSRKGLLYLAMELVEGPTLAAVIDAGPLDPGRAIRIARGLAAGLGHAHDRGLIHRDLKPANVILVDGPAGEIARIADFGIAISAAGGDARLTATGFTVGTPAYVAPEQLANGATYDHRADLYALGVTLFEMVAGVLPFTGTSLEQIVDKSTRDAPRIADRAPEVRVPAALEAVIARLLVRRPDHRYGSAREVIEALDACLAELEAPPAPEAVPAPAPVTETARLPRVRRRRVRVLAPAALAAIVVVVGAGWLHREPRALQPAEVTAAPLPVSVEPSAWPAPTAGPALAPTADPDAPPPPIQTLLVLAPTDPAHADALSRAVQPDAAMFAALADASRDRTPRAPPASDRRRAGP
jgi:serine/threonine-protein kinase